MAFEQGAGVLEVLFGVGFGGGDAVKRFVEDADDPLLFGERRNGNRIASISSSDSRSVTARRPAMQVIDFVIEVLSK